VPQTGQTTSYRTGDDGDLEQGAEWPNPRFTVSGDSVTDNLTGLMWTKDANFGSKTWGQAKSYCSSLSWGGYDDWRLPNVLELQSLIDYALQNPALPTGHPFTDVGDRVLVDHLQPPSGGYVLRMVRRPQQRRGDLHKLLESVL